MKLLNAVTSAPTTGQAVQTRGQRPQLINRAFQAYVKGTGAVSATVVVEVSNEAESGQWLTAGTIALSGTTSATDGFVVSAAWTYVRARLTAISGTGAAVTCIMGV